MENNDKAIPFRLIYELTVDNNLKIERHIFNKKIFIRCIENGIRKKEVIYDSELKNYFERSLPPEYLYEIETEDVDITTSGKLAKASDLIRRLHYRYDWILTRLDESGVILKVDNVEELKNTWIRLKKRILKDYYGDIVDNCLEKIDKEFIDQKSILKLVNQYLFFGILFPQIPIKHNENWENIREIELSEYEDGNSILEQTKYIGIDKEMKYYRITGEVKENSELELIKYDGYLWRDDKQLFPWIVYINIEYIRDSVKRIWTFRLNQYLMNEDEMD